MNVIGFIESPLGGSSYEYINMYSCVFRGIKALSSLQTLYLQLGGTFYSVILSLPVSLYVR